MTVRRAVSPRLIPARDQRGESNLASTSGTVTHITSTTNPTSDALNTVNAMPATPIATKARTKRAASQFKSPVLANPCGVLSSVRLTPTIQALERTVQVLKRAVKVRKGGEEAELEELVRKWTEAGREVAYELWGLVKDNGSGERRVALEGKARTGFGGSWGWDESPTAMDGEGDDKDKRGQGEACLEEEEDERQADTVGTMLRQLGIAPETLGWNEEEGMFV